MAREATPTPVYRDLADGETYEVPGKPPGKCYIIKNSGGVYSCSDPSWRNQGAPTNRRTCKHIKALRGEAAELLRIGDGMAAPKDPALVAAEGSAGRALRPDEKAALLGPPVLLAQSYWDTPDLDPTGWWMSEKLDGVRAWWDGKRREFVSRYGNVYKAPPWFTDGLPDHNLDGELWMGRGLFQATTSIVKRDDMPDTWDGVRYVTFDMPHLDLPFEARMLEMNLACTSYTTKGIVRGIRWLPLHQRRCTSRDDLLAELDRIVALKGEGLMLRKAGSLYVAGRSDTLLKVKRFSDAEGEVVGHTAGKGKNKGKTGAIIVKLPSGQTFNLNVARRRRSARSSPTASPRRRTAVCRSAPSTSAIATSSSRWVGARARSARRAGTA